MAQILPAHLFQDDRPDSAWPSRILNSGEAPEFRANFNKLPFQLSHTLADHPLFEIERLVELSQFLSQDDVPGRVIVYTDLAGLHQGWNRSNSLGMGAPECLKSIQSLKSWVMLKDIQKHPVYNDLIDGFIEELEELTACPLRKDITWIDAYLFIASPGMITPYHMDHESNFLLQIHGQKTMNLFDPSDRTILTDDEIERYYVGDINAAQFREEIQCKAKVFDLKPGVGVHHPPLAPHWVCTGDQYSVSLSLLFFLRDFDLRAKVYQVNHYLRAIGLRPTPPGPAPLKDRVKQLVMSDLGYRPRDKNRVVRFGLNKYKAPSLLIKKLRERMKG